ncbi:uncharacterized protein GGS22DRAFT_151331 [Annulohypoxylon maeteangense]|uniref:uncharacterized protein n=1 Tax=Annulohypoxylon maeteangense TaxID=1927788 RepID=UPI002007B85D|nr:uncharacterized protein GGS22DRAFT_151331 [Annulohypoxylon maeteangense]KAI0890592.1 hypothetical protein GGS22DRAFT_151331 [Annulohypoxylon maeteangense]
MNATKPTPNTPYPSPRDPTRKDEWEDWEDSDEEGQVTIDDNDGLLIDLSDEAKHKSSRPGAAQGIPRNLLRYSVQKPTRVKSKARQKAQNAKAGITLVTDMTKFRQSKQRAKFVNPTALQALEGEPSSASIGSFSWLKQRPGAASGIKASNKYLQGSSSDLSPVARPIVIGISVPSDNLSDHQVSPHTAVIETPTDFPRFPQKSTPTAANPSALTPHQLRSVWSPDTEASESPYQGSRAASSLYSQPSLYSGQIRDTDVPPVPALPTNLGSKERQTVIIADLEDDSDLGTPCTLFEEDGSPTMTRKSVKPKAPMTSPESAASRSHGWWDHVTTPFTQQTNNPFKQQAQETGPSPSSQQWNPFKKQAQEAGPNPSQPTAVPRQLWDGVSEKGSPSQPNPPAQQAQPAAPGSSQSTTGVREWWNGTNEKDGSSLNAVAQAKNTPVILQQHYIVHPASSSSRQTSPERRETRSEKARILLEENQRPNEEPPPYSPPKPQPVTQVKYGVILPPPVVVNSQRVPSPGPVTPGLAGTMTSQGAINMAEIPLTPHNLQPVRAAVLPDRAPGSFVPGDHFYDVRGQANRTERQRRRHEKEEVIARKAGGFWRGRGCMPKNGCFGRSGREGRKRRRICLCVIAGLIAAIILAIVLAVVLTRRPRPQESSAPSIWLNLTDFPPMPTGVLTVAAPDNSLARTGCLVATSDNAWSCSLPKDQQASVAPKAPNQPEFIFQIQYDNNTRALWNVTEDNDEDQPTLFDSGFNPNPQPPSIAEIRFLGNTTDHIQSDNKAGEPTPFFISTLTDVDKPVGANMLTRRQGANNAIGVAGNGGTNLTDILPPPQLNGDGTGAPAQLFPHSIQQPVRLFDRGLPTEHYGFYTHFDKTIYMVDTVKSNAADVDGGSTEASAKSLVTLSQTRFLVQIWTRLENSTQLLGGTGAAVPWTNGTSAAAIPGTMPYPVTITEDMHGGDKNKKIDYRYGVLKNQAINTTDVQLIIVDRGFAGTLINGMNKSPNTSLGGIDGGTGGCKCEWVNFKGLKKVTT